MLTPSLQLLNSSVFRHLLGEPLEESDAALYQSLWGASSSAEHHQQQGISSYQANVMS
ncbi:unnamed protein product [Brassica oleracea var. botrytis]|uniref:Uncharacterized protein n=1 Tax=Brassica oleracea TaxID=3712 RepID=A0A3P6DSA9_BRAOL|nr:unnamed protein product [Brassica oleracea]